MKTRFLKSILMFIMVAMALPIMGQDCMNIYFKDGKSRKFYLKDVTEIVASKYDAEGKKHSDYQYQHVITNSNNYVYNLADIDSVTFTKYDESAVEQDKLGECFIDIPEETSIRLNQLTILDDGSKVEADVDGYLGMGLGDIIVFNGDNIVYISYGEETEDRVVNSNETAISLLLHVVPFSVTDLEGDGFWLFKQMIGHLSQTREFARAIEQSIIEKGYLDMERVTPQYQAAYAELMSRLGFDDIELNRTRSIKRVKSTTYPLFLYGGKEAKGDGFSIIKESSIWGKAEKEKDGYCWKCNFTLLNADRWCYTGVTKMRKNNEGTFNRIDTTFDGLFRYLVKPMNVSAFMDFGTLSDLATNPKEFLVSLSDPDFDRVVNQFWEPLKNLGHVIKGEPTETTTFDKVKVSDIKFDLFPDNEHLGVVGPGTDGNLMLLNILKIAFQPIMKLMIKEIKKSDNYKNDRDYGDKLLIEFVKWIAEADIPFRQEMLATFTDSSLPWTKRIEIIGEKTYKKFEKFLVEDVALSFVSEQVYKSFLGYVAKGYDDPQVKAIFGIYKTILVAGDILLFAIDAEYQGIAFEIDYGPSLEDIHGENETFNVNGVSFDMIHLTGGSFMMGAADDDMNATSNEKPLHALTLSNFALGETEVTQALWEAVMGSNPSKFKGANRPVENVTWLDCQEFIAKLNSITGRTFRLPTEAEWEYAATGGLYSRGFLYAGSNDIDKVAWYKGNSEKETHPVKQKKECNEFGFYDMSGNVFEWCQDFYDVNYYDHSPDVDPCNDVTATLYARVLRGGCWHWDDKYCRVSSRHSSGQGVKSEIFGLRLAMSEIDAPFAQLQLSVNTLTVSAYSCSSVQITSGSGSYSIEKIEPSDVVTAEINGNNISIEANKAGSATITVKDTKSGQTASIEVTVIAKDIPAEPIDLGLPSGTKWASYNVGATKPEEYGGYYAWGETEVRDRYYFTTYSLCDGTVSSCHDIGENISGTEYDVAHVKWGGDWCMPTKDDFQELVYTCEYKETTRNGVKGYQFTGPNGQYIFLPYTGYYWNTENSNAGSEGCYWSATQTTSVNRAHEMSFKKDEVLWDCYINRFAGLSVRPVMHSTPSLADLSLSTTGPLTVVVDDKTTIEITSGNGSYTAESDNEDVAIARVYDNASVIIKGESVGTATITVTDTKSGQTATVAVTVTGTFNPDVSSGEAIDLGLPSGTKWASCNVGATKPEEYGGYYAWGETEEKEVYNESTYKYYQNGSYVNLGSDISGTEYDVAHVKWGGNWCMPTLDDINELLDNCTYEWTTLNGVNGRKFISKINGNSIFLPAAGNRWGSGLNYAGEDGSYWSSTRSPGYSYGAYVLFFVSGYAIWYYYDRYDGRSVRPVARN